MWICSSVCLLVGSAFVVPPTSSLLHPVPHAVVPQFSALRRCHNDMRMAVADDDFPEIKNIFIGEDDISAWLKERKPSVAENLKKSFPPGRFDDGVWRNLFRSDFEDKLTNNTSTGKDFARFFDCAKRALQSLHEKSETVLNEEALERKICLWVQSLLEELLKEVLSTMVCDESAEGVPDPPKTEPPKEVEDYALLKVSQLKQILRKRSLTVSGRKAQLIERLKLSDLANEEASAEKKTVSELEKEDSAEKKTVFELEEEASAEKKTVSELEEEASAEKKTVSAVEEDSEEMVI